MCFGGTFLDTVVTVLILRQHYVYLSLFLNWQVLEDQLLCFIHLFVLSIRPTVLVDNVCLGSIK